MVADDMLAFIAHNFFTQDRYAQQRHFLRWNTLDDETKNHYIFRALESLDKWKQAENNQEKVKLKPRLNEHLGSLQKFDFEEKFEEEFKKRLGSMMDIIPPLGNNTYEEPPF